MFENILEATQPESKKEKQPEEFERNVARGAGEARMLIKERFESTPEEKNRLDFHNWPHTETIIGRVERILLAIQKIAPRLVSERDLGRGETAAAFHDTVQNWKENKIPDGEFTRIMRKRYIRKNEKDSTNLATVFMDQVNTEAGGTDIFSKEDKKIVSEAIDATVPDFSPEKGVFQPNLKEDSLIVARALALADLGGAGMDGPEVFLKEGDALFREENLDIRSYIDRQEPINDSQKEYFRKRMLGWSKFQPVFATGRKNLFEDEIKGLPEEAKTAVRALFDKFDVSIEAAKQRAEKREKMSFEELAEDMGYKFWRAGQVKQAA